MKVRKRADVEFSLNPRERATYGATVTARSMETGKTRTFARTDLTAVEAVKEIVNELDLLPGDFRIVTVSTPVSIARDIYASRIALDGPSVGIIGASPELLILQRLGRVDMLHPDVARPSKRNSGRTAA